jgi:hypothetical protein
VGIRNKVTKKGFVSTNASDVNSGFFALEQQLISAEGVTEIETSFVIVSSSAPGVTASLPPISDEMIGTVVRLTTVTNAFFFLSASNPIVSENGTVTDWTRLFDGFNLSKFQLVDLVAIGSSTGPDILDTGEKFVWAAGSHSIFVG